MFSRDDRFERLQGWTERMEAEFLDLNERFAACKRRMEVAGDCESLRDYCGDLMRLRMQADHLCRNLETHYKMAQKAVLGPAQYGDDNECPECDCGGDCPECMPDCECGDPECKECCPPEGYTQVRVRSGYKTADGVFHDTMPPQVFPPVSHSPPTPKYPAKPMPINPPYPPKG